MLIVSKFHDYYDTASIYGVDKTCVYLRDQTSIEIEGRSWREDPHVPIDRNNRISIKTIPGEEEKHSKHGDYKFEKLLVGFCGSIYPLIRVTKKSSLYPYKSEKFFFYEFSDLRQFMEKEQIKNDRYNYWYRESYYIDSDKGMTDFFDEKTWSCLLDVFHTFRTPCFAFDARRLHINPTLKGLGFMKIKDPQTTFQDIYMFLSGVLGAPAKPKEKMSDKVLAAAKGHDGPYSFRKPPGKRGKKQWR